MKVMKGSESFKQTIQEYLQVRANTDEQFAKSFAKENKNIDECINFILNTVKESGCCGFDDEEIYGIAVHYYDEDELDPKYLKAVGGNVVVNHKVQLTAEEMAELAEKAKKDYYQQCLQKQKELIQPKKKVVKEDARQQSLF